jgi:hypothetical protein
VELTCTDSAGNHFCRRGEFVIADYGVEGSLIYAAGALIREEIRRAGTAVIHLDLAPDHEVDALTRKLSRPRGSRSLASHLQSRTGLKGVKTGLLWEFVPREQWEDAGRPRRGDKKSAHPPARPASNCRSDQQRRRRFLCRFGSGFDGKSRSRPLLRRGNARLGSANRWVSIDRLLCHRPRRRFGCAQMGGKTAP